MLAKYCYVARGNQLCSAHSVCVPGARTLDMKLALTNTMPQIEKLILHKQQLKSIGACMIDHLPVHI